MKLNQDALLGVATAKLYKVLTTPPILPRVHQIRISLYCISIINVEKFSIIH